jgi:hypothetical protein
VLLYSSHLPLGVPNGLVIHHASSTASPSTQAVIADGPSAQEIEPVVQAPRITRASIKKVPVT